MPPSPAPKPVVLCILDGWGYRPDAPDNATTRASAPVFWNAWKHSPRGLLEASEEAVGLPKGQMGNSEVGHMNLGAGRVVYQELPRIDNAIQEGSLAKNPNLLAFIEKLQRSGGTCHLMGLASPGGVHAHQNHMIELARLVAAEKIPVALHLFLDGRDVPPQSADEIIPHFEQELAAKAPGAFIATLCGRYFAMDRDKRWDRVTKAYDLLTQGFGTHAKTALGAIEDSYLRGATDEFFEPIEMMGYEGMKDGDGLLCANFRADRAREILEALLDPAFDAFPRQKTIHFAAALGMVEYSARLNTWLETLFPPHSLANGLGEVVAQKGLKQLRLAETEKYPHVTFFFNGGREEPYEGEERILVPSPKVATYDLEPAMSAGEVTAKAVEAISSGTFDLIVLNYANPDMVGHTGSMEAAVKAVEALDLCLGLLFETVQKAGGVALVTADHGNCETMFDPTTQGPHTAHTLARVPVMLVGAEEKIKGLRDGKLADVAPTILALMGLSQPAQMTGKSLLVLE